MTYWKPLVALLLAIGLFAGGYYAGHHFESLSASAKLSELQAHDAEELAKAQADARSKEQLAADTLAHIQAQNEQDKADAQAQYEKDVADLRSGNLRLRKQWTCPADPGVSGNPSGTGQPDAEAITREQLAAEIVRLGAEYDAWVKALQDIVKADRGQK